MGFKREKSGMCYTPLRSGTFGSPKTQAFRVAVGCLTSVPLIAAGEITPEISIAIGQVAKKYTKALFLLFLYYHL